MILRRRPNQGGEDRRPTTASEAKLRKTKRVPKPELWNEGSIALLMR
jgi:hypothetical protein